MTDGGRSMQSGIMNRMTKRERIIVFLTIVVGLSALLYQFPYTIQKRAALKLEQRISAAEREVLELTGRVADLKNRSADIKAGRIAVRGWDLGDEKGVVLFLEDASSEAKRLGVNLVSVNPSQEVEKEQYKEVSMNLDIKARYRDLAEYFRRLETLSQVVNIRKIRLESCPDTASVCNAHLEAVTYLAK